MTREEAIAFLNDHPSGEQLRSVKPELLRLLREPYLPEADIETLRIAWRIIPDDEYLHATELRALLEKLIAKISPIKVEWVDRGIYSVAAYGGYSLLVCPVGSACCGWVRDEKAAACVNGETRDDAKRACEQKLAELLTH